MTTSTEPDPASVQLTIHAELVSRPHSGNPTSGFVSRVLLKDEQGYNRAVLVVGQEYPNAAAAHESAIRTYEAAIRKAEVLP